MIYNLTPSTKRKLLYVKKLVTKLYLYIQNPIGFSIPHHVSPFVLQINLDPKAFNNLIKTKIRTNCRVVE